MGLFVMAVSIPFYFYWRKGSPARTSAGIFR
jgi:hypothetical protein